MADAQSREVPLQRIADTVAGKFCYTVMASSAITFAFWALAGHILLWPLQHAVLPICSSPAKCVSPCS